MLFMAVSETSTSNRTTRVIVVLWGKALARPSHPTVTVASHSISMKRYGHALCGYVQSYDPRHRCLWGKALDITEAVWSCSIRLCPKFLLLIVRPHVIVFLD